MKHSFKYEGECGKCGELYAGCRFCRASEFEGKGCSCAVEGIHITRHQRWRRLQRAAKAAATEAKE
jgi:hypothetical protein